MDYVDWLRYKIHIELDEIFMYLGGIVYVCIEWLIES